MLAFLLYGLFSDPTPDNPGLIEAAIGLLLMAFVGTGAFKAIGAELAFPAKRTLPTPVVLGFVWLITVPSLIGVLRGADALDFARDVIPLLYLLLPALAMPTLSENPEKSVRIILWGFAFVGVMYTVRFLHQVTGTFGEETLFGGIEVFIMDPAVLFSATFLLMLGTKLFFDRRLIAAVTVLAVGAFIYAVLASTGLRAQIVLVAFAVAFMLLLRLLKHPVRFTSWLPVLVVAGVVLFTDVGDWVDFVVNTMLTKTEDSGLANSRDLEMAEVLELVSNDPMTLLFGAGWGAKLYLSTSGDVVRYTHSTFFFLLWKTGLLGLIFFAPLFLWVAGRFVALGKIALRDPVLLAIWFGCLNVLVVYGILEVGYKILTFGFTLCLILLVGHVREGAAASRRSSGRAPALSRPLGSP